MVRTTFIFGPFLAILANFGQLGLILALFPRYLNSPRCHLSFYRQHGMVLITLILDHFPPFWRILANWEWLRPFFFNIWIHRAVSFNLIGLAIVGWVVSFMSKYDHFGQNRRFLVWSLVKTLGPKWKLCVYNIAENFSENLLKKNWGHSRSSDNLVWMRMPSHPCTRDIAMNLAMDLATAAAQDIGHLMSMWRIFNEQKIS